MASLTRRLWIARGVERQQLKWFVFPAAVGIPLHLAGIFSNRSPAGVILVLGGGVALTALPICIGIAILRYRLYDIDLLINRTLVYALLTAMLGGLYVGQIFGLQALFRAITGQQSDIAVAISTLVIVAVFNPVRRRIQDLIARAFYRRKYDAARVLAAFGATCRDETDLSTLRAGLTHVVEEALQPAHVSLWLRDGRHEIDADRGGRAVDY